jgi:hypothetical protein
MYVYTICTSSIAAKHLMAFLFHVLVAALATIKAGYYDQCVLCVGV